MLRVLATLIQCEDKNTLLAALAEMRSRTASEEEEDHICNNLLGPEFRQHLDSLRRLTAEVFAGYACVGPVKLRSLLLYRPALGVPDIEDICIS